MNNVTRAAKILAHLPDYPEKHLDMQSCNNVLCSSMKTPAEYKQLRELTRKRWEETIQHDETERDKELSALDLAWELIQKQQVPAALSIADMMRKVISKLEQPFQSWQVQEKMLSAYPEIADGLHMKTISGHLTRMVRRGELEMPDPGSGTTPGRYKIKALKTK